MYSHIMPGIFHMSKSCCQNFWCSIGWLHNAYFSNVSRLLQHMKHENINWNNIKKGSCAILIFLSCLIKLKSVLTWKVIPPKDTSYKPVSVILMLSLSSCSSLHLILLLIIIQFRPLFPITWPSNLTRFQSELLK